MNKRQCQELDKNYTELMNIKIRSYTGRREDVMVIYDANDNFTENVLFPHFTNGGINFSVWLRLPGRLKFDFFDYVPKKVLFVLSKELCGWEFISFLVTAACLLYGEQMYYKIITFVTTGELTIRNKWSCLQGTCVINARSASSCETLLQRIRFTPPSYVRIYDQSNDLMTTLGMTGLGMKNIEAEIFGVFILGEKRCVQIDLKQFYTFRKKHNKYKTSDCLDLCGLFKNKKTSTILVLNGNTEEYLAAKSDIAAICSSVVETKQEKQEISNWDIVCTVRGRFSENQEKFVSALYPSIWSAITGKYVSSITKPKYPEFENEDKRINSFPNDSSAGVIRDEISRERLGKAGLFHTGTGDRGTCYFCGCTMTNIRNQSDPLIRHAAQHPDCNFVRTKLSEEEIREATTNFNSSEIKYRVASSLAVRFSSFEARLDTFKQHEGNQEVLKPHYTALAQAGFYYVGGRDNIQCFSCSIRLYVLPPLECVWEAHAMVAPSCKFLLHEKADLLRQMQRIMNYSICPDQTVVKFTKETYEEGTTRDENEVIFRPW